MKGIYGVAMTHSIVGECCIIENKKQQYAGVAELADAPDLGSGAERCVGSSPTIRTKGLIHGLPFNYHLCGLNGH